MRCFGRLIALPFVLLILAVTPCAFWTFNISRVAMNPQTYKTALHNENFSTTIVPALVDAVSIEDADNPTDPQVKAASKALIGNMTPRDWALITELLLPPNWLQEQIDRDIDNFFDWVNAKQPMLDISFDLSTLKTKLTGDGARSAVEIIIPKLPPCTPDQETYFTSKTVPQTEDKFPFCNPVTDSVRKDAIDSLTSHFTAIGNSLPPRWDLIDELRKQDVLGTEPSQPVTPGGEPPNRPGIQNGLQHQKINEFQFGQFRASIWVLPRLMVLLFLIPIALFALIMMVTIRSGKEFFRWGGWLLILSGLLTLVPVPLVPASILGAISGNQTDIQSGFGSSGILLFGLIQGMINSIASNLTLAVLMQVAVVIVIGFIAVFLSVLLTAPEPEVTHHELIAERAVQMASMGSTPRPLGSTATPTGSTPTGQVTPPPAPPPPDPVADIFLDI